MTVSDVKAHALPHTLQPAWPARPARCPARVRLGRVLLGRRPSLHGLRRRSLALVRPLRRYYAAVRLPAAVHEGLTAHRVLPPARSQGNGRRRGLPVLARRVSRHAWGLRLRGAAPRSRCRVGALLPSVLSDAVGSPQHRFRSSIPSLPIPLSNASETASRPPPHGSGPGWFATPSLYDSFIRYSLPVYPGAIRTRGVRPYTIICVIQ